MRFARRRLEHAVNINLVPLIDVLLLLIIFFMITTTFKLTPGISLTLPSSSTAQTVQSSVIRVVAVSEAEIYVDRTRTDLKGLPAVIKKRAGAGDPAALKAMLEGDKNSSYQLMVSVLDALRRNGIESVGLRTRVEKGAP
ncbi:MAG TPA: biopolymer transporter ExbD [Rectinemataceae bacterium]|nr:biopolymer transporter ExbD [Rectinemataceae bacterium]